MKRILFLLLFCFFALLCACDYQEINRGLLVTAIGIAHNDSTVNLTIEVINSSDTFDQSSSRQVISSSGNNLNQAFSNLGSQLVKPLYFEQLGAVVLENTSPKEAVDFLEKIPNINYGIYIVKTDDVNAIFHQETTDTIVGYDIIGLVKNYCKNNDIDISNQMYQINKNSVLLPMIVLGEGNLTILEMENI